MTSGTAELAVIDSSVYIENVRSGRFREELLALPFLVRVSAVVVAELGRGARSRQARRFVDQLGRLPLVAPSGPDWVRSGTLVRILAERHRFEMNKVREIHFDVLIALGARSLGAHLITCNAGDFRAIREILAFRLICW